MISSKEEKYCAAVDAREKDLTELSKKIWGYAELGLKEKQSAKAIAEYLEKETTPLPADPAGKLVELFLDSDTIDFLVGTRVNEAHLDPTLPVYLEIRRNIIQRIAESLRTRYLKNVTVTYI